MELAQDKIDLIEKIIKNDKKFANNEDLFDDFLNETCKHSVLIVKTVTSDEILEAYLKKIVTTSIVNVLKSEGRLRKTRAGYIPNEEVSFEDTITDYSNVEISYGEFNIQETPEDLAIKKEILQNIVDSVYEIDESSPDKNYLELYILRFEKGMTQKEIASETGLSQSEVSKRLFKLMENIKRIIK